jgi:hypothetical protein
MQLSTDQFHCGLVGLPRAYRLFVLPIVWINTLVKFAWRCGWGCLRLGREKRVYHFYV